MEEGGPSKRAKGRVEVAVPGGMVWKVGVLLRDGLRLAGS